MLTPRRAWTQAQAKNPQRRVYDFARDVGVMWDLFTFAMTGTATEEIDLAAGRYRMVLAGGQPITVHTEARGASERGGSWQSRHIAATRSGGVKAP
jgi:hypothetical protein